MSEGAKPGVFISHTSADEELARGLGVLVDRVFDGGVTPWYSSDKGPLGGLSPGQRWYERIEEEVCGSIQVLAVITRRSRERPWIYWEAGMGSIACKGKVCPVTFRVEIGQLGPPLSYYQAVDGLDEESLASGVTKIGPLVDLRP